VTLAAKTDVLVVGAGPAGSNTARLLAQDGHDVTLIEEDPKIGLPMQCAGLVTPKLFAHVPFHHDAVRLNWIRGATIYSPKGRRLEVDAGRDHALVMDRAGFDAKLANEAERAGAHVSTQTRYVDARPTTGGLDVRLEQRGENGAIAEHRITTKLLVGADGVQSNVGRDFGMPRPRDFLGGFEAEMDGLDLPSDKIIPVFTDQTMAPGFFSWIIPLTRTTGRAGLCMQPRRTSARRKFDEFLLHPQVRPYTRDPRITKPIVGTVPLGMPRRFTADRVLLVGDACAMPKPTSGGGIWTGIVASVHAAAVATKALADGDLGRRRLKAYEDSFWRSKVGREIRIGWRLRRAVAGMSNTEIEEGFRLLHNRRALGVIDSFGDIDHPSHLLVPLLLAEPRLLKMAPKAFRRAFGIQRASQ
jgi:digeranylgeranylglycerophospholipid reductase